jgi:hypothetical protein
LRCADLPLSRQTNLPDLPDIFRDRPCVESTPLAANERFRHKFDRQSNQSPTALKKTRAASHPIYGSVTYLNGVKGDTARFIELALAIPADGRHNFPTAEVRLKNKLVKW